MFGGTFTPHPNEVDDYNGFIPEQMVSMMDGRSMLFSPWFRTITNKLVEGPEGNHDHRQIL
jgi:isopentenyldiphosphate isomerase